MKLDLCKMVRLSIGLSFMFHLLACQQKPVDQNHIKVRIPLPDKNGNYTPQTVELRTVTNLSAMSGKAAYFRTEGKYRVDDHPYDPGTPSTTDYQPGDIPSAHFSQIGDTFYADDFLTLVMATSMYHFEKIKDFFDTLGANDGIIFPRPIMLNIDFGHTSDGPSTQYIDNAAYLPNLDIFLLVPYRLKSVPLSMNGGVLTHENSHSVLNNLIKKNHLDLTKMTSSFVGEWAPTVNTAEASGLVSSVKSEHAFAVSDLTSKDTRHLNYMMLGCLNEGLADYFGYEYSARNGSYMMASLPEDGSRNLSSPKIFIFDSQEQIHELLRVRDLMTTELNPPDLRHEWGAFIARSLFQIAQEWGPDKTLRQTMSFETRVIKWFSENMEKTPLTMNEFFHIFFENQKPSESLINELALTFPKQISQSDFAKKKDNKDHTEPKDSEE